MPRSTHRPGGRGWPLGYPEIAIFLGVRPRTVERWKDRRLLPPPDGRVGGSPYWWEDTIRDWAKRRPRWPGDDVTARWLHTEMQRRAAEQKLEEEVAAERRIAEQMKATKADLQRLAAAARATQDTPE